MAAICRSKLFKVLAVAMVVTVLQVRGSGYDWDRAPLFSLLTVLVFFDDEDCVVGWSYGLLIMFDIICFVLLFVQRCVCPVCVRALACLAAFYISRLRGYTDIPSVIQPVSLKLKLLCVRYIPVYSLWINKLKMRMVSSLHACWTRRWHNSRTLSSESGHLSWVCVVAGGRG